MLSKPTDNPMSRFAQLGGQVARKLTETLSEMQVAGMDESESHQMRYPNPQ
jgi:hypothetical protein